jgi:hypothetical protein
MYVSALLSKHSGRLITSLTICRYVHQGVKYDEADQSANLMMEIFPELLHSTDIYFVLPSKKALRRFPCIDVLPRPLPTTLQGHRLLSDRIHRNLVEIADLALRQIPQRAVALDRYIESKSRQSTKSTIYEWSTQRLKAMVQNGSYSNESEARIAIIRTALPMQVSSAIDRNMFNRTFNHSASNYYGEDNDRRNSSTVDVSGGTNTYNILDSLVIETTQKKGTANANAQLLPFKYRTTRERFSINIGWIRR